MKFSEWTKRADSHVINNAAGDNYEQLPKIAKDCIDSAVKRFIKFSKTNYNVSLPSDGETEKWFKENIGIVNDCSSASAIYKFRLWLKERGEG